MRTGSPWRDLPVVFGKWNTAFRRFRDWREADIFKQISDAMSEEPDMEYVMVDATICQGSPAWPYPSGGARLVVR